LVLSVDDVSKKGDGALLDVEAADDADVLCGFLWRTVVGGDG
jgi:hypothetical protein